MIFLERVFFLLLLFLFPIQLGKHFWPEFSFVQGIRLDYLSPTLYLTDIVGIALFISSFWRIRKDVLKAFLSFPFLLLFLGLGIGSILAYQSQSALFGMIKLSELLWFGFYVSKVSRKFLPELLFAFTLGGLVQVIILTFQFFSQSSIGGIFYYLGERTFVPTTLGIALFRLGEELVLRPYGTFPHPNVLACYLLLTFTLLLYLFPKDKIIYRYVKSAILLAISFGIVLTFSRVVLLLFVASLLFYFWNNQGAKRIILILTISLFGVLFSRFVNGFIEDFASRFELLKIGWLVFLKNPLFGVGLNNFHYHEIYYQKEITPNLLQPIHSIYFHWLVSVGIVGSISAVYLFINILKRTKNRLAMFLIIEIGIIGLFDHYLITLQQGQLIIAFVLGFYYSVFGQKVKVLV